MATLGTELPGARDGVIDLGSRLELFVDDYLIDRMRGSSLELQAPVPREVVMTFSRPWEGPGAACYSVFQDGDTFRLYYRGARAKSRTVSMYEHACCAKSVDGILWTRPKLGPCQSAWTTAPNIVCDGEFGSAASRDRV